jgi:uncharacterized protein (DUF1697 family)
VRQVVLLRGINIGPRNRVAMPELRRQLTGAGLADVQTYLQSGNVVLTSDASPDELARACERLIEATFGLNIAVITRTRDELAGVVELNPLGGVADNPKRYQVSFLSGELLPDAIETLTALRAGEERFEVHGREAYAWHPEGVARSKLWNALAGTKLGATATSRNWTTVTSLLRMADA